MINNLTHRVWSGLGDNNKFRIHLTTSLYATSAIVDFSEYSYAWDDSFGERQINTFFVYFEFGVAVMIPTKLMRESILFVLPDVEIRLFSLRSRVAEKRREDEAEEMRKIKQKIDVSVYLCFNFSS